MPRRRRKEDPSRGKGGGEEGKEEDVELRAALSLLHAFAKQSRAHDPDADGDDAQALELIRQGLPAPR